MKKKILALSIVLCLAVTAIAGATLAYFTDEDEATNVFVMGGVKIELQEDFDQNSQLLPGLDINKDVRVRNIGSADAYVRVHIAIPAALDDGDPSFNATNNFLHFNFASNSVVDGQWSWIPEYTTGTGYKDNGKGNWNYYEQEIDGIDYGVYVVTYRSALLSGEITGTDVLDKVYVDTSVDCEWDEEKNCYYYTDDKGNIVYPEQFSAAYNDTNNDDTAEEDEIKSMVSKYTLDIKIIAEAAQTATFENAYDALNTSFGVPGTYNPWFVPEE